MLKSSIYIFGSKMVGYGLRILLPIVLVRLLTKAEFGAYRQFFLLEILIATLFQLGINQALYYFIPRDEKNSGAYFVNSLLLNVIIYSLAFTIIGSTTEFWAAQLNMPIMRDHFWQIAAFTLLLSLAVTCDCYLTSRQLARESAVFEIVGQVAMSVATLYAAFAHRNLNAIFTALVIAKAVHMVAMLGYIHVRLSGFRAMRYFFDIWPQVRYGLVLGIAGTLGTVLTRLNDLMVSRYFGTEGYAVYSAGLTDIPFLQFYTQSLAVVSLGQFALMEKQRDWEGIRRLWDRILTSLYCATIPTVIVLLAVAKPLVLLMFTPAYAGAVPIFQINSLIKLQMLWNATLVLRALGRNDVTFWVNLGHLVVAPFLFYVLLKEYGPFGVIIGNLLVMLSVRLVQLAILNRVSGLRLRYVTTAREMIAFYRECLATGGTWIRRKLPGRA